MSARSQCDSNQSVFEQFLIAAALEFLERWGYEHNTAHISPWAPPAVQAAWHLVMTAMGEELEVAVACWAVMLSGCDLAGSSLSS